MNKLEEVAIVCESCHKKPAQPNEFNYIICEDCLAYYMECEVNELISMTDVEQMLYWKMYSDEHNNL